eukprot:53679_1
MAQGNDWNEVSGTEYKTNFRLSPGFVGKHVNGDFNKYANDLRDIKYCTVISNEDELKKQIENLNVNNLQDGEHNRTITLTNYTVYELMHGVNEVKENSKTKVGSGQLEVKFTKTSTSKSQGKKNKKKTVITNEITVNGFAEKKK